MRRGVNGTDAIETISAAATAVASLENRVPQASFQKRRWGSCWSVYWCFGSYKNNHRIGHAVLVPETAGAGADAPVPGHLSQPPSLVPPFVAPPSSPASFLPSEPPSATQSPTGLLSLTSASANMYSPGGPASIFAIGPYAHETQLVSPPFFSTFTTEPSTAPYTPPPESAHFTTPSSPEVPFAWLLEPNLHNGEGDQRYRLSQYEFQSYQLQPGSPVSHLISPCSGISGSGTASPFPDREFASGHPFFLEFRTGNPPKLLDLDKIILRGWESYQGSGAVTPDASGASSCEPCLVKRQDSDVAPLPEDTHNGSRNDDTVVDHRVSFEIPAEEVLQCAEREPVTSLPKAVAVSVANAEFRGEEKQLQITNETGDSAGQNIIGNSEKVQSDSENGPHHKKTRTITLGSAKEFKFDNIDGHCDEPVVGSDWWANEKILGEEGTSLNDWSFFPMMQTGVS